MSSKITDKEKLEGLRSAIKKVIAYPAKGNPRRTVNGYPSEVVYDRWAYERMVRSFRDALKTILKEFK